MPKLSPYQKDDALSYALGPFPCMELYKARPKSIRRLVIKSLDEPNQGVQKLIALCKAGGIRVEEAPKALERIAGKENCYCALVFEKQTDTLSPNADHVVLVNPSDMGNAGTIMRTMLGFSYKNLCIIRPGIDPFDPRVIRASMGAMFHLNLVQFKSLEDYFAQFPGRDLVFFRLQNAAPLSSLMRTGAPLSLFFGNEATGLPPQLQAMPRGALIEQGEDIDSLNLSVAAGIGLYHFKIN